MGYESELMGYVSRILGYEFEGGVWVRGVGLQVKRRWVYEAEVMGLWVEGSNYELRVMGYDALVRGCGSGLLC